MFRMATMLQKKSLIWYFHGCCSIFSQANARHTFLLQFHETIFVTPPQQNGKGQWKDQRREEGKYQASFELPSGAQGFFAFGWPLRNSASNSWVGARDTAQHNTGFIASFRNKKMGNKKELPSSFMSQHSWGVKHNGSCLIITKFLHFYRCLVQSSSLKSPGVL